jgi:2-polyprenyl-3-methyl-5-hydroxy-6-metoxy-1,4-benzoquinol methylase
MPVDLQHTYKLITPMETTTLTSAAGKQHAQALPSPAAIMQTGTGFWASKVLLAAVKFNLFTHLAERPDLSGPQIKSLLKLKCTDRNVYDFLDTLTSFGFLRREGILETARYSNGIDTGIFLDRKKPSYLGGMLEMLNNRLYNFWGTLEEGLMTGLPQNEAKKGGNLFAELYKDPEHLAEFIHAMSAIQMENFSSFARQFDFSSYETLMDAGGAGALLSITVARQHAHMHCTSFDLPQVQPIASDNIKQSGVADRVVTASGDFFADELPKADVVVMGNILHDWDEERKIALLKKAYAALNTGGAFVAIESIIDEDRKENTFGLLMSLNMLIETGKGFDYTFTDFNGWARTAGFSRTEIIPLTGPSSAAIAYK